MFWSGVLTFALSCLCSCSTGLATCAPFRPRGPLSVNWGQAKTTPLSHENKLKFTLKTPKFAQAVMCHHWNKCTTNTKKNLYCKMNTRMITVFGLAGYIGEKYQNHAFTWTSSCLAWLGFPTITNAIFSAKSWSWSGTRTLAFLCSSPTRLRTWCPVFPFTPLAVHCQKRNYHQLIRKDTSTEYGKKSWTLKLRLYLGKVLLDMTCFPG